MPVRLLENLGAQPTLLPLFPGASKIADRLTGLHSLLRVGQPHGDPHAGLNTLMMDVGLDRKSTRLNSSHLGISYAVFCLKKKKKTEKMIKSLEKFYTLSFFFCSHLRT